MELSLTLIFSFSIFVFWLSHLTFGKNFALDYPDSRKNHFSATPQIGGIIFGSLIKSIISLQISECSLLHPEFKQANPKLSTY